MMDIYHKALKNPDPPKKAPSTNKSPPDYHQVQPPPPPMSISLLQPQQQGQPMTLPPLQPGPSSNTSTSAPAYLSHLTSIHQQAQVQQPQQLNYSYTTHNSSTNSSNSNSTNSSNTTNNSTTSGSDSQLKDSVMKKKKNSRRKHRNSHLGCGTCKKRRIKCDETLPACLNCLKGKLHCAYLNLDNNARNALRIAQYNQNIRQEKLDSNGKFIDELRSTTSGNGAGVNNIIPQPGMMSAQHGQPIAMAPGSAALPAYPLSAAPGASVLAPNMPMSAAAAAASSANLSPFINSVIAPGIQPPQNNTSSSPQTNSTNSTAGTVRTPPQQQQTQPPPTQGQQPPQQQQQQQQPATMTHIPPGHIPSPQIVQSPYGPLVPVLTQTGSVVYAPTSTLSAQPTPMITTALAPQPITIQQQQQQQQQGHPGQPAIQTLPPPIPQQGNAQSTILTPQPQVPSSQPLSNPSSVPHLSPILSQQPSVVPITSNAGSVANIASHNIRLSADKNEAARKSEISSNILPPINTNRSNSIDGKSPTQTSATTNSTTTEKSPITLPSIPKITSPTNNDNDDNNNNNNNNIKKHSISTTSPLLKEEKYDSDSNNVKLPSINVLKREASKSPPNNSSTMEEEKVSISKLIS